MKMWNGVGYLYNYANPEVGAGAGTNNYGSGGLNRDRQSQRRL